MIKYQSGSQSTDLLFSLSEEQLISWGFQKLPKQDVLFHLLFPLVYKWRPFFLKR